MFRSGLAEYNAMSTAFANFVKTGDPNGPGVPQWQEFGATGKVMYFAVDTRSGPEEHRERYEFLDAMTID
jgi:para-nitrobenzyl esterase